MIVEFGLGLILVIVYMWYIEIQKNEIIDHICALDDKLDVIMKKNLKERIEKNKKEWDNEQTTNSA